MLVLVLLAFFLYGYCIKRAWKVARFIKRVKRRLREKSWWQPQFNQINEDVMTQPMPGKPAEDAENELDIRGLFRTLWAGKLWIIGMGLAFALIALAYTFLLDKSGARRRLPIVQR